MTPRQLDDLFRPLAQQLQNGHMSRLGIAPTMSLANTFNRAKFGDQDAWRRALYELALQDLLEENGGLTRPPPEMHDGWALDASMSLPHLDRMLAAADEVIAERAGIRMTPQGTYRSYFQEMWAAEDCERYPALLDFATSSDLLATVCHYLQCIPALSTALPTGIRLVESNAQFDEEPSRPKDNQLYHIDYYSLPNVYVLVLLRDTTFEHGPWTFLPRGLSQRVRHKLDYWQPGRPYRLSDDEIYSVVKRKEAIEFCYPRGTVLFIESSGCFHYGSRNSIKPRFQLMLGYTGVCRTDFAELLMRQNTFPCRDGDSFLRRLVLQKNLRAPGQRDQVNPAYLPYLLEAWQRLQTVCNAAAA